MKDYKFWVNKKIFSVFATIFLLPALGFAFEFRQDLFLGMPENNDVLELQKILNRDIRTAVSFAGAGSLGNETSYFGEKTKAAVIKFQELFSSEILSPIGLFLGTGRVGPLTRQKLNQISLTSPTTIGIPPATSVNTPLTAADFIVKSDEKIDIYETDRKLDSFQDSIVKEINSAIEEKRTPNLDFVSKFSLTNVSPVVLFQISSQEGNVGKKISLSGKGFDSINSIYFGNDYIIRNISSKNNVLEFTVPPLPPKRYDIVVKNSKGLSDSMFFIIKTDNSPKVRIDSVLPESFSYGDSITIKGSGFSKENNEILTPFENISGLSSSDGATLSFTYAPESFRGISASGKIGKKIPVSFSLINDNGFTNASISGTLNY